MGASTGVRKHCIAIAAACLLAPAAFVGCTGFHVKESLHSDPLDWPMAGRTASGTYADSSQTVALPLEERWDYDLTAGTAQNACIIVDSVLVCGTLRGELVAVDAATGDEIGTKKISVPVAGAPAAIGSQIFFCSEAGKETVFDYDLRAGEFVWKKNYGGITASPIIGRVNNEDRLFIASLDGSVYALRPGDGEVLWKTKAGAAFTGSPCMLDSMLYCADIQGTVYALSASSGRLRWKKKLEGSVYAGLSASRGTIYIGSRDHTLYALDAQTGAVRWTYDTGERIMAAASVSDSLVIVPSLNGSIAALTPEGRVKWTFSAKSAVNVPAVIAKNMVIAASLDTYLYALSASDGSVLWKHSLDARIKTVPVLWNNSVFVVGDDRTVYRFSAK